MKLQEGPTSLRMLAPVAKLSNLAIDLRPPQLPLWRTGLECFPFC